jgi:hypothetical protein
MHFEIFIEDISGKNLMDILVPKIISPSKNTFNIHPYKGIGKIPEDLHELPDPKKKLLLNKLPAILKAHAKWLNPNDCAIIVIVDCDRRDCKTFKQELVNILDQCDPKPNVFFRIAIEEIEAWLLGDKTAIEKAYPRMNQREYAEYKQDKAMGTWEKLADITLPRDTAKRLKKAAYFEIGKQKIEWARKIGAYMDINHNESPSFNCFKQKLEELAQVEASND